jgi:hypothetical protein
LDHGSRKIRSCTLGRSEVTWCEHESFAAMHQPLDTYFQTELFATGNEVRSQIRNSESGTTISKIVYIFIARTRKMKCKFRENVKLQKHKIC